MLAHDLIFADRFFDHSPMEWVTLGFAGFGVLMFCAAVACIVVCIVGRSLNRGIDG